MFQEMCSHKVSDGPVIFAITAFAEASIMVILLLHACLQVHEAVMMLYLYTRCDCQQVMNALLAECTISSAEFYHQGYEHVYTLGQSHIDRHQIRNYKINM